MKAIQSNLGAKLLACILCVACLAGTLLSWGYCGVNWDFFFSGQGEPQAFQQEMNQYYYVLYANLEVDARIQRGESLNYPEQKAYEARVEALDPRHTNFRYIVRDYETGQVLFTSWGNSPDAGEGRNMDHVRTRSETFGIYEEETDKYVIQKHYVIEYGVEPGLPVQDALASVLSTTAQTVHEEWLWVAGGLSVATVVLAIFLCVCAGHKRGVAGIHLNWQDKIPLEIYAVLSGGAVLGTAAVGIVSAEQFVFYPQEAYIPYVLALGGGAILLCASFCLAALLSFVTRLKSRTLLKNSLAWRVLCWCGRGFASLGSWWGTVFGSWPITGRVITLFFGYLLGSVLTGLLLLLAFPLGLFLVPLYQGFVLWALCRYVKQWNMVRAGTQAIVGGEPDAAIDTTGMKHFPDLKEHAEQLGDLGNAINSAVEERMRSERMKAELITNVSHDLKTPLTSIINYVDLLKKVEIPSEKAREYIEVLDRKSQRLKKLTEDLVEASKASTGALTVEREKLDFGQLVRQAAGEYEEKLTGRNLSLVADLPEGPLTVLADGRHLWRVLDNLLGNCVKYALEGTRVYLTLTRWDGNAVLTVKNISADALNIPAEQLMERFVRGEESRTTEGSGLGLSIARSLTELQGGAFSLSVDGDLFKATVRLPLAE